MHFKFVSLFAKNMFYFELCSILLSSSRLNKVWNEQDQCVPLHLASLLNISRLDPSMIICQSPKERDIFELHTKYMSPILNNCSHVCEKYEYEGKLHKTIPKTAPIEVCYWIGSNNIISSEEYLIYDMKVLIGSTGGTMGLFLGFSFQTVCRRIFSHIKTHLREN